MLNLILSKNEHMSLEILSYPFLFIALFFESFVLVTFLSAPARRRRAGASAEGDALPTVAVIVPCYNEEATVRRTAESVLALEYPTDKLSLVLVDDGSTDGTRTAMERFRAHPQVTIIHKERGGKHTALNVGIATTEAEIVGCLDADSFVEPDTIGHIIPCFDREQVAAVTAAMSVHLPSNILQYMQNGEYLFGIAWRHTLASVNGLYVTPGPFSFYRRNIVKALGGFRHGHQVEDMEMALRLQRHGYAIENAPRARVYTEAPSTISQLFKQRTRWTSGFLRNVLFDYRDFLLDPARGALGTLVLPLALISIESGILLFAVALVTTGADIVHAVTIRSGMPFSYAYLPSLSTFDWFYFPATFFTLLAAIVVAAGISLIIIGQRISHTPSRLAHSLCSYLLLYGLMAPLWLTRATADVALGKTRSWQ